MPSKPSSHENPRTQYTLCLALDAKIDRELHVAGEAGFSCVELWAPALEAYLASHPVVWLDLQLRQHGIQRLIVSGLAPLSFTRGTEDEDALVSQARFLELCTHLDALGGATLILHPAADQRGIGDRTEVSPRVLRAYADLAAPFEIELGLEFRADSTVPTLEAAQDVIKAAARSNLRLSLSTHEWCTSKTESRALSALEPGQLARVYLDSPLSQPSRAGTTPKLPHPNDDPACTLALCAHLAAAGFRGPFCIPSSAEMDASLDHARAVHRAVTEYLAPLYPAQQPHLA